MRSWIIYEEPGFMVVNKPAGILSQKDKSGDDDLATQIQKNLALAGSIFPFLAPIHRLDRNTSGLIILAKTPESAKSLSVLLQEGKIKRTYLAVVKGDPGKKGSFDFRLKKNVKTNEVSVSPAGDEAITDFTQLQKLGNSSLMLVKLQTGRSHQIRVHFSHAGHALIGDKKYAKKPWSEIFGRPALHAVEIEFPSGKGTGVRCFKAPTPKDILGLISKLGGVPV